MNLFDSAIKRFLAALQFLTILPLSVRSGIEGKDLGESLIYFPVIGLLIGALLAGAAFLFSPLPGLLKSAIIVILSTFITGGIHLDGFADTCDGFYGSRSKEKILEIMRDSRIGSMGAMGLTAILLLKFSVIATLPNDILWKALIAMAVFSRWAQVLACGAYPYARGEGKAKYFIERANGREIAIGVFFTLAVFFLLMHLMGILLFFVSAACVYFFMRYINKKIGGMTGDTIGAVNEIAEVSILLLLGIMSGLWNH